MPFFNRYVNIITCVPEDQINTFLQIFNSFQEKIQFTVKIDENNRIYSLDLMIIRSDNNILKKDWCQKPSNSERYVNLNFEHQHKMNVFKNLIQRKIINKRILIELKHYC